jgi:hypothetical protein
MPISLYEATVPTMVQMLGSAQGWIEKAKACDFSEEEIASACLADDMAPFAKQVNWMLAHSIGAIEAVRAGEMTPDLDEPTTDLEQMRLNLGAAENKLRALPIGELDSFVGQEVHFVFKPRGVDIPFTAENFLLSFSQPNFFFHATTAYAILRHKGLDVGKMDYLGQIRTAQEG